MLKLYTEVIELRGSSWSKENKRIRRFSTYLERKPFIEIDIGEVCRRFDKPTNFLVGSNAEYGLGRIFCSRTS